MLFLSSPIVSHMENETPLARIGEAIRALRVKRGWKQAALAEAAGVSVPNLSDYELGKSGMTLATLDRILAALEFDVGDLAVALGQTSELQDLRKAQDEILKLLRDRENGS